MQLSVVDWIIMVAYLLGMIGLSVYLSRGQKDEADYYLGGNDNGVWPVAISTMATQCSTNSILGAPAFVAFSVGGGLVWLQYEIAMPLAMIVLMVFLLPLYRRLNVISVYGYLEERFGVGTRTVMSVLFQFMRAFATGVTVYGISLVLQYCLSIPFWVAVIILGVVTVIYDSIGGMKAVIYSDVIQMVILYLAIVGTVILAIYLVGGIGETFAVFSSARTKAVDFASTGFDGKDFGFWPMLFGGLFLYISYYGCDQTQVQRELSTKNTDDTNLSLFINGTLRFPLVLTYCLLGICIGAYVAKHPEFLGLLPKGESGNPNYNVAVPVFVIKYFPVGMVGLFMVGLFSAAMSSLDSTINSLSATTMEDILKGLFRWEMKQRQELLASKGLTVFWGIVCVVFAFFVGGISDSIIVSINKIGSLANGPILAVFTLGVLTKRADGVGAVSGLVLGFGFNLALWKYAPEVSWLWWNVTGFLVAFVIGWGLSLVKPNKKDTLGLVWHRHNEKEMGLKKNWVPYYWILGGTALMILAVLSLIGIR